jgi:hypothetical protein
MASSPEQVPPLGFIERGPDGATMHSCVGAEAALGQHALAAKVPASQTLFSADGTRLASVHGRVGTPGGQIGYMDYTGCRRLVFLTYALLRPHSRGVKIGGPYRRSSIGVLTAK